MAQGKAEELCFVFRFHASGGGGHGYALQTDHLPHYTAAGIRCSHQDRIETKAVCRYYLQVTKQSVGRGITAGQKNSEPSQQSAEKWEKDSGGGKSESHGGGCSAIVHQKGQAENAGNCESGTCQLFDRSFQDAKELGDGNFQNNCRKDGRKKRCRPGCGKPV